MDTGVDLHNPTHYEIKQSWEQKSPQEIIDSALETQREREKKIREWIRNSIKRDVDIFNTLKIWISWDIAVLLDSEWDWNVYRYSENYWVEYFTNMSSIINDEYIYERVEELWYTYINWLLSKNWKNIPTFLDNWEVNPDYIKAIADINFISDLHYIHWWKNTIEAWEKVEWDGFSEVFNLMIVSWSFRIKDIVYFAWKWYIPEKDIPKLLKRAISELPNQCGDTRFYQNAQWTRMWAEVTKQEVAEYLKPTQWAPLITQETYDLCIQAIEKRDTLLQKQKEAREQTSTSLEIEKTRNWVLDRVKELLWWD